VIRSNRSDAKVALEQTAASLERCFTRLSRYDDATPNCPIADTLVNSGGFQTPSGTYQITQTALTQSTYTLQAAPLGRQADDTQCANFTLTQINARAVTGTLSATPQQCWSR
jgi:type IV pilus assembly protein PilE